MELPTSVQIYTDNAIVRCKFQGLFTGSWLTCGHRLLDVS